MAFAPGVAAMVPSAAMKAALPLIWLMGAATGSQAGPGVGDAPALEQEADTTVSTTAEPLFASPTRIDRIGRIVAPVYINGQGPFRLVVDTGASHSTVSPQLA